jgi:Flp pilus assembly protein TadG
MRCLRKRSASRGGTAAVETAVVLPVYILLLFGVIEFGHAHMVVNLLHSGTRNGARMGSTAGPTTAQVMTRVRQTMGAGVDPSKVNVWVQDASSLDDGATWPMTDAQVESLPDIELASAEDRQLFVVRASVAYNDISLLPMPFLSGMRLQTQCFMRHE